MLTAQLCETCWCLFPHRPNNIASSPKSTNSWPSATPSRRASTRPKPPKSTSPTPSSSRPWHSRDRGALFDMTEGFIPQHGGFRKLRSFQAAQLAYDGTVIFCDRFIDKRSRTHDQMVQAARSGGQNIAEGSLASATSKETEVKLTNVARASLGELLLD